MGHNWIKCNLDTDKYPYCGATDESSKHLLQCKHKDLKEVCRAAYITIQKSCDDAKNPLHFTRAFLQVIHLVLNQDDTSPSPNIPEIVTAAVEAQHQIGFYNMIIGSVANEWKVAL